jgi:hypothetical protein
VGNDNNIFVDDEACWDDMVDAREDTAKMAMNALCREGVPMDVEDIPDAIPVATKPINKPQKAINKPQRSNKRKASMGLLQEKGQQISSQPKEDIGLEAQHLRAPRLGTGNPRVNIVEPDIGHNVQEFRRQPKFGPARASSRTRAGLMRRLSGILQPQERVGGKFNSYVGLRTLKVELAMCDYLMIQKPEYWTERYPYGEMWLARFLSEQPTTKIGHTLIAPTVVHSLIGSQDCARRVEHSLFEKIYGGEIPLEDGCAVFPDRALQQEQTHQSHLRPRQKQLLERDEGLSLATINQRYDRSVQLSHPSSSAKAVPSAVAKRPLNQACRKEQDTGYESEDELPPNAMILAGSVTSKQLIPASNTLQRFEAISNGNGVEQFDEKPHLLHSGVHRYVSPPPFLDTTRPHLPPKTALPPPLKLKSETQADDPHDDDVVYVGQRSIRDGVFVRGGAELEEVEIL